MKVWYSIQKNGSVRFMESEELCELDQKYLGTDLLSVICFFWDGDQVDPALIATVESEIARTEEGLRSPILKNETWIKWRNRFGNKLIALKALQLEENTIEKTFKIRMSKMDGKSYMDADDIEHCLTYGIHIDNKITVTEVE